MDNSSKHQFGPSSISPEAMRLILTLAALGLAMASRNMDMALAYTKAVIPQLSDSEVSKETLDALASAATSLPSSNGLN